MKHYILLSTLIAMLVAMNSCTDEIVLPGGNTSIEYKGEPVDAFLKITVGELSVGVETRETTAEDPYEDTEAERWVNDLWVFQYDATTKVVIADPFYLTISDQETLKNLPVTLSDNNGKPSIVYVVANASSEENWGSNFTTVEELMSATIHTHEPIFVEKDMKIGDLSIPMEGNSDEVTVEESDVVTVPVTRMFAKIMIDPEIDQSALPGSTIYSVGVGNIPLYCRVGSLYVSDDTSATYPTDVQWVSRSFTSNETLTDDNAYPYIVYVPENIQGKAGVGSTSKLEQEDQAPAHALQINIIINYFEPIEGSTDGSTIHYPYTVYPGADIYTDYNIKRNNVYRVKVDIKKLSLDRVPSANCFVALEGETIDFYPYYRVETGGGYVFTDYLNPYGEADAQTTSGAKIDHVGIVWQTKDCIGDNSDGSRVYLNSTSDQHTGYERIYVKANKEGNALIAAYDTVGNIIWSWHIWVRTAANGDPTHPASALIYYTYDWDASGIYSYQREEMGDGATHRRVAGYELMACNLGALQDFPNYDNNTNFTKVTDPTQSGMSDHDDIQTFQTNDGIVRTFGMLYQWGRKDPFPPMTETLGCLAYSANGSDYNLPDNALNSGYYVHNYDDAHTEQLYGNDNETTVHKTSYGDESCLFHSHIHNTTADGITGMRYSIAHPTVFLSGASTIATCLDQSISRNNADYTSPLNQNSISSDGSITNYAFGGAWSDEDHDNKEWGGLEPDEATMKYYHLTYPDYTTTGSKKGQQITDNAGRTISLWDNYDDNTGLGSKTIFDPCPYGWRVAAGDLWIGFARNGISPYIDGDRNAHITTDEWIGDMSNINRDPVRSCGLGMTMYLGQEWMTEPVTWFPCQGFRLPDGSGYRVGGCGNYVNANTDVSDRVNVVHFHDTFNSYRQFEVQTHYTAKSTGNPLRCVRDTK